MKLIDKDAVVAEIEKRKKEAESNCGGYKSYDEHRCDDCTVGFYKEFLEILDTLEVKEVDLDNKIKEWLDIAQFVTYDLENADIINTAVHFFKLGLKALKGE